MTKCTTPPIAPTVFALAMMFAVNANSLEYSASVGYRAEHSDNADKAPGDGIDDVVHGPIASIRLEQAVQQLDASVDYSYRRRDYKNDTFPGDNVTTGRARATWRAIQNRLTLDASNARTLSTFKAFENQTPENEQTTSVWNAGATLILPAPGNGDFNLGYSYEYLDSQAENSSEQNRGTLAYVLGISEHREFQFLGDYYQTEFDDRPMDDIDSWSVGAAYAGESGRFDLEARLGYRYIEWKNRSGKPDADGPDGDLQITYSPTTTTQIVAGVHRILDYRPQELLPGFELRDTPIDVNSDSTDVFKETGFNLGIASALGRFETRADARYKKTEYEEDTLQDEDSLSLSGTVSRRLSTRMQLTLNGTFRNSDFTTVDGEEDFWSIDLGLEVNPIQKLDLSFGLAYEDKSSDLATNEYNEVRFKISLSYRILDKTR